MQLKFIIISSCTFQYVSVKTRMSLLYFSSATDIFVTITTKHSRSYANKSYSTVSYHHNLETTAAAATATTITTTTAITTNWDWDYPGEPTPEETHTHSHRSWSSTILYVLQPSTTIYSMLPV